MTLILSEHLCEGILPCMMNHLEILLTLIRSERGVARRAKEYDLRLEKASLVSDVVIYNLHFLVLNPYEVSYPADLCCTLVILILSSCHVAKSDKCIWPRDAVLIFIIKTLSAGCTLQTPVFSLQSLSRVHH